MPATFPGRFYVNSGDWVQHCSWAEFSSDRVRVLRLARTAPGAGADVLFESTYPSGTDRDAVLERGAG